MATARVDWRSDGQLWVELFAVFNFAALVLDIFLAHSQNQFRHRAEYIPFFFSIGATAVLALLGAARSRAPGVWRDVGHLIGWLSIAVGLVGVILHLDSQFFDQRTIRSLTYAAPFAAPLAYTGLGLLIIANRLIPPCTREWAEWVLLLALGGFVGNFVFSLTDHAQNGFFNPIEWVPVGSSALAVGFLLVPFISRVNIPYLKLCALVLVGQAVVGVAGFVFHAASDFRQPGGPIFEKILSGAPPMAPLLFPNLVVLALIALWSLARDVKQDEHVVERRGTDRGKQRPRPGGDPDG